MLRVRNEARWLSEVLGALKPVCERLFVMDDKSTDGTDEIARQCGATVMLSPFCGIDESRDKDWLLGHVQSECPAGTWVLCIDGDEVLDSACSLDVKGLAQNQMAFAYMFRIIYLWDRRDQMRVDGVYGKFSRPSMFRLRSGLTFKRTGAGGNLHCSSVPAYYIGKCAPSNVRLLHLGYLHREDRLRKFDWYRKVDPKNRAEDGYRHIVQGDVPEVPAAARLMHAGPLELRAI